jgi:hypothetical protein
MEILAKARRSGQNCYGGIRILEGFEHETLFFEDDYFGCHRRMAPIRRYYCFGY